jgi:uncharacterized membrane protein
MTHCSSCGAILEGAPKFCPSCGSPVRSPSEQAQASATHLRWSDATARSRRIALLTFSALLLFGLGFFVVYITPSTHEVIKEQPVVAEPADYDSNTVEMKMVSFADRGNDLVFSLEEVKKYRLIRFDYPGAKTTRSIMAYIAPDGRLVTAISLSEHCGSNEFTIKDNQIYCARCPSHWDMMTMEAYACCAQYYPDPILSRVIGNEVYISKDIVERWAGRL